MVLSKCVVNSFTWAVMGFALTGPAYGQVPVQEIVPEIGDGSIIRDGQIETDTVTEAPAPPVDAATDVKNNVDNTLDPLGSSQNAQQTYDGSTQSYPGSNNQSYSSDQLSHSAARPMYGMESNQGFMGGCATSGHNSNPGQACCGGSVHVQQCGYRNHGGRRHRRCCR